MKILESKESAMQDTVVNTQNNDKLKNTSNGLFVKVQDYFRKIPYDDIIYIEASGSYCNICLKSGDKITVAFTLSMVMDHLRVSNKQFIRVHRSFIIGIDDVTSYVGNMLFIGEKMIPIGRMHKKEVLSHFNILGAIG